MIFQKSVIFFLQKHKNISIHEEDIIDFLRQNIPLSLTHLDWSSVSDKLEIPNVSSNKLKNALIFILSFYEININDDFYILHINDAIPFLKCSLYNWLEFVDELNYSDMIFVHKNMNFIIHYDFYRQLYAKKLDEICI